MTAKLKAAGVASLLFMAAGSMNAAAAPLPFLTYQQYAGFDSTTSTFTPGTTGLTGLFFNNPTFGDPYPDNTYRNISWFGTTAGNPPSSIDIVSHNQGDAPIPPSEFSNPGEWQANEWAVITTLIQTNNRLTINGSGANVPNPLWTVDAVANLSIYDNTGANLLFQDLDNVTTIEFWETFNNPAGCGNPNPFGTICDDIFRVTALDFADISFVEGDYKYTVEFTLFPGLTTGPGVPDGTLTIICQSNTPGCEAFNIPVGQIWVFTPESAPGTSTLYVAMRYTVSKVPEPSIVGLFAMGILGLGLVSRRRKTAS